MGDTAAKEVRKPQAERAARRAIVGLIKAQAPTAPRALGEQAVHLPMAAEAEVAAFSAAAEAEPELGLLHWYIIAISAVGAVARAVRRSWISAQRIRTRGKAGREPLVTAW